MKNGMPTLERVAGLRGGEKFCELFFLFFDRELTGLICVYRFTPWLHVTGPVMR